MRITLLAVGLAAALLAASCGGDDEGEPESVGRAQWTIDEANAWYAAQPFLAGSNFTPSTASNQLEMWQAETFDEETIDRELAWGALLMFNTMRVYLHDIPWRQDAEVFLDRVDRFLAVCERHGIRPMLVLFDGVWDPFPQAGPQAAPRPGVHNSRWVQSPGAEILGDPSRHDELEPYVRDVIGRFRDDPRVLAWDLFNEPDNPNPAYLDVELGREAKAANAEALLRKTFEWARAENPSQPLTAGVWSGDWSNPEQLSPINRLQLTESDIVTFHSYDPPAALQARIDSLEQYGRPIVCTEWLARSNGSRVETNFPIFIERNVGAYNWGLVSGRTQTIYSWLSWVRPDPENAEWFHDLLHPDGSPYSIAEVGILYTLLGPG